MPTMLLRPSTTARLPLMGTLHRFSSSKQPCIMLTHISSHLTKALIQLALRTRTLMKMTGVRCCIFVCILLAA